MKALQSDTISVAEVRVLFDSIIEEFPTTAEKLSIDANIVNLKCCAPGRLEKTALSVTDTISVVQGPLKKKAALSDGRR